MIGKSVIGVLALLALSAIVAVGTSSASSGDGDRVQGANELVGSWELSVNRGPVLPPVKSLTTYTRDGSMFDTANVTVRGPSHGTWEHLTGRQYANTHVFFRFDPAGAYLGTQRINETVELAQDGESFTAVAISNLFDTNGNLVAGGLRATITATRIHVEPGPDQP
jgi:hypothetical protein